MSQQFTSQQFGVVDATGAANQTSIFLVDAQGKLCQFLVQGDGAWNGPVAMTPAGFASPGSCVTVSQQFGVEDQTNVFLIDASGQINLFSAINNGPWNGPLTIGPSGFAPPGSGLAASQQFGLANQTDLFIFDYTGQLNLFTSQIAGIWSPPQPIGRAGLAPPGSFIAVSPEMSNLNQTNVFFVDGTGQLNLTFSPDSGTSWVGPIPVGPAPPFVAQLPGAPLAVYTSGANNPNYVFAVDQSGQLNLFKILDAVAEAPMPIGPANFAFPGNAVVASPQFGNATQIDVFLVDKTGQLNVFWLQGSGTFSSPVPIGPPNYSATFPLAVSQQFGSPNQTDVFVVDRAGRLNVFWTQNAKPWSKQPARLGPPGFLSAPGAVYNVRDYGATGSGNLLDTYAINAAVTAAYNAGGGTVVVPAGTYLSFSIRLRSNVCLSLAAGSIVIAANSPKANEYAGQDGGGYDPAGPTGLSYQQWQDYGHNHWANSLIYADSQHNFQIVGAGLINGQGLASGNYDHGNPIVNGQPGYKYNVSQPAVGNKSIGLKNCWNVILRDFNILQGGHFGLLLTGVNNVTIDNLTIDTNRDGMDIDCCRNVRVSNCSVNSPWDDGICLKSSYALNSLVNTENVTIANCLVSGCYEMGAVLNRGFTKYAPGAWTFNGRIKLGTESNGGFMRIAISNCIFEGCQGLAIESADGAVCEDIAVTNLTMRDLTSGPLFIVLGDRLNGPNKPQVGVMRRILISNIVASNCGAKWTNFVSGLPGHPVEDIKIANFYMQQQGGMGTYSGQTFPEVTKYPDPTHLPGMPAQGFFLRHIQGLVVSQAEIAGVKPDGRYAFVLQDVNTSWFEGIIAPTAQLVPVALGVEVMGFSFWPDAPNGSTTAGLDFHIHNSEAFADTDAWSPVAAI